MNRHIKRVVDLLKPFGFEIVNDGDLWAHMELEAGPVLFAQIDDRDVPFLQLTLVDDESIAIEVDRISLEYFASGSSGSWPTMKNEANYAMTEEMSVRSALVPIRLAMEWMLRTGFSVPDLREWPDMANRRREQGRGHTMLEVRTRRFDYPAPELVIEFAHGTAMHTMRKVIERARFPESGKDFASSINVLTDWCLQRGIPVL